jgi:hypothetical protein
MNAEVWQTIAVGDIISYTLSSSQLSTHPLREYRGVVNRIDPEAQMVSVTLLDEEFEALNEPVRMDHIQSIAKSWRDLRQRQGQPRELPTPEEIRQQVAALNAVWQLYARAIEQQLDSVPIEALQRDFVAAREGLAACGIAESLLVYDCATMTFSLPLTGERGGDDCAGATPGQEDFGG